ncbi:TPA: hypothetical protein QB593_000224 [Pasteurella multocida]|nr:hypothetical protein [Pasteurella multocida]HDR1858638.1 hypothetical protein [Pasteurella multocida]HEH9749914.1 hypothetical protein [Pasteurella multocida]
MIEENNNELALIDEYDNQFGVVRYIDSLPSYTEKLDKEGIKQLQSLVGESFKSLAIVPNRALEVYFKPEIAKGLKDRTYKLMESKGEKLADAVIDKPGLKPVVGKGRIKTNVSKQIAAAGFQLLSFAVAQSHLDNINSHLYEIEALCNAIRLNNENNELGKITGNIQYLEGIIRKISKYSDPYAISLTQRNEIEASIRIFAEHKSILIQNIQSLIERINNQSNIDTFGSEKTFITLRKKMSEYDSIIKRIELLSKYYILLFMIIGYLDPCYECFSLIDENIFFDKLNELDAIYRESINTSANKLLAATFNANDTLELRKEHISLNVYRQGFIFNTIKDGRKRVLNNLSSYLDKLKKPEYVKYALQFDEKGNIEQATLV